MEATKIVRYGIQVLANISLLTAICLILTAMFTAQWQIADVGDGDVYEHGLYKDCVKSTNQRSNIKTAGDWLCYFKFDQRNQQYSKSTILKEWQSTALALFGASCVAASLGIICSGITYCVKYFSIPCIVLSATAAILSLAGLITFLRWSNESENRLFHMGESVIEQRYGYSLSIAIAGSVLDFFATILFGVTIGLVHIEGVRYTSITTSSSAHTTKI